MPYKLCPNCRRVSYSSTELSPWPCPYCGKDISFIISEISPPQQDLHGSSSGERFGHLRLLRGENRL